MGEIPNDVKVSVRSVLLSKVGGVLVNEFTKDYKALVQKKVPYNQYGYDNLEDFFKAIPDVVRLEYSKKDMAYRVYGITSPNTYTPTWVEKSQRPSDKKIRSPRQKDNGNGTATDDSDLLPDSRNRYSIIYPRKKTPDYTEQDVKQKFANTGNVRDVHMIDRWIFVRYKNQDDAKRAHAMYRQELDVRFPEANRGGNQTKNNTNDNKNCSNNNNSKDCSNENVFGSSSVGGSFGGDFGRDLSIGASTVQKSSPPTTFPPKQDSSIPVQQTPPSTGVDSSMHQLYIGNLSKDINEQHLDELIGGRRVTRVSIKRLCNGMKVVAFVSFTSKKDADDTIAKWDGQIWHGRDLLVRHSNTSNDTAVTINGNREATKSSPSKSAALHTRVVRQSTPSKNQIMSDLEGTMPNLEDMMPALKEIMPNLEEIMPELEEMMPELEEMMPQLEEIMPDLEDAKSGDISFSEADDEDDKPCQIFVGNFPAGMTERELYALFRRYEVTEVKIINNSLYGCTRAYVKIPSIHLAVEAILDLDQIDYMERVIKVCAPYHNQRLQAMVESRIQEYMSDTGSSHGSNTRSSRSYKSSSIKSACGDVMNMNSLDAAALLETFSHIMTKLDTKRSVSVTAGQKIELCVTSWLIEQFYFAQNASDEEALRKLLDISTRIQNNEHHLGRTRGLGRCAALYMGEWYRAWILRKDDIHNGNLKVFYIDYGNVCVLPWKDTRIIPSWAWDLQPQAYPIHLLTETELSEKDLVDKILSSTVTSKIKVDKCPVYEVTVDNISG